MCNSRYKRMKFFKILSTAILIFMFAFFPLKSHALVPPLVGFGGLNIFSMPCTCSFNAWAYYAPLYLSPIPMTGPLVYTEGASFLFANFIPPVDTEASDVGAYLPGAQICVTGAPPYCFPMPSIGAEVFLGTSIPGGV